MAEGSPQPSAISDQPLARRTYGTLTEEGSVRRHAPPREGRGDEPREREESDQDVVAALDGRARDGRPHARRAQRQEVHPGLRDGEHGRPQARRVRADAPLQGTHDEGGREGGRGGRSGRTGGRRPRRAGGRRRRRRRAETGGRRELAMINAEATARYVRT